MASIVRNMDTGKSVVNRGNDYLPSWANATDDIAADGDKFAQEAGVQQTIVRVARDSTNSLGLRRTSWSKASTGRLSGSKAAPTSDQFQGGQNQAFKQGRGENSLHGIAKGMQNGLGFQSMARDISIHRRLRVHSDATAAIGIARRRGLGKLRHLDVED